MSSNRLPLQILHSLFAPTCAYLSCKNHRPKLRKHYARVEVRRRYKIWWRTIKYKFVYFNITFYVALTVLHYFYIKLPCSFGQAFERTSKGHGFKPHLYPELKNPNVAIDVCIYVYVYIYIYIHIYIYY